jgi:hypothetical protein
LTGAQPDQTAAVLSVAKSGLSSAVAGLPQLVQSFQQAQQNSHGAQPGLQDLVAGIQNLVGGEDTSVATQPNKDFFSVQKQQGDKPQTTPAQQRILSGQVKMLDPGEQSSNTMFPAGVRTESTRVLWDCSVIVLAVTEQFLEFTPDAGLPCAVIRARLLQSLCLNSSLLPD